MIQRIDDRVSCPALRLEELSDGRSARVWLDLDLDGIGFSWCLMSQPIGIARGFIEGAIVFSKNGELVSKPAAEPAPAPVTEKPKYVKVHAYEGVAWRVVDSSEEPWSLVMVGDDQVFKFDPEECESLDEDAFCHSCGQTACGHQ